VTVSLTDAYGTPAWLTARLPLVHLDPCSNPRSTVRAVAAYMLERGQDGLALPWAPSIFINWPYSDPMPWVEKLLAEVAAGRTQYAIILPKHDHSTEWWARLTNLPRELHKLDQWQFHDRIHFDFPPELLAELVAKHNAKVAAGKARGPYRPANNFCSSLLHWRPRGLPALELSDVATLWSLAA
jgi:DNA N-6-adenine-methyltransferase Dam